MIDECGLNTKKMWRFWKVHVCIQRVFNMLPVTACMSLSVSTVHQTVGASETNATTAVMYCVYAYVSAVLFVSYVLQTRQARKRQDVLRCKWRGVDDLVPG